MWDILPSSTKIIWVPLLLKIFGSKKYLLSAVAGCLPPTTWPHWLLPAYQPQQTAVMTASDVTAQPASLCLPQLIMQTIPAIRLTMFNIQYNMIYCTYNVGCRIYCSEVRSETTEENRISNKVTFFHLILLYLKWEGRSELVGQIFSSEPGRAGEEGGGRREVFYSRPWCIALYSAVLYTALYMMYWTDRDISHPHRHNSPRPPPTRILLLDIRYHSLISATKHSTGVQPLPVSHIIYHNSNFAWLCRLTPWIQSSIQNHHYWNKKYYIMTWKCHL